MEDPLPSPDELARIRARLQPEERHRLRPDGLMEPSLPPMTLCGGLQRPYLCGPPLVWDEE